MGEEFELLVASLSRRFISLAPEALEEQLEKALGLVGEFAGADSKAKTYLGLMFLFYILALVAIASAYKAA